jgi:hypothetical protein
MYLRTLAKVLLVRVRLAKVLLVALRMADLPPPLYMSTPCAVPPVEKYPRRYLIVLLVALRMADLPPLNIIAIRNALVVK